ncbi:MAG: Internalin-like protein [Flavobacteriaceae bacterium FS1-H7996/R]|nr:MAG: Internalin-like protein [Flavobacteriaceae bacterium FS1-H7996/R]
MVYSQTITIPDTNLKNILISTNTIDTNGDDIPDTYIDINNDGEIQLIEAEAVTNLIFQGNPNILDITGLESFINLTKLNFGNTYFFDHTDLSTAPTNFDFTSLTKLESLILNHAESIKLKNINISGLENLRTLELVNIRPNDFYSESDRFTNVNLSGCINLENFSYYNSFLNIDFCQIPNLKNLNCSYLEGGEPEIFDFSCLSKLEVLDISENFIDKLILKNGSILNNITHNYIGSGPAYPFPNFICLDDILEEYDMFSDLIGPNTVVNSICSAIEEQIVNIPDVNFKNILLANGTDSNNDGEIQVIEAENKTLLSISNQSIESLEGIQYFINLTTLSAHDNLITSVNLSALTKLKSLDLANNSLTSLDVSLLTNLEYLYLNNNSLTSLNVDALTNLKQIDCSYNPLKILDVSKLVNLVNVNCSSGNLTSLSIGNLNNLNTLICGHNELTELDIKGLPNLTRLACNTNQLTSLNLDNLSKLENFNCQDNAFTSLDFSMLPEMKYLTCGFSNLSVIDVSNSPKLEQLVCGSTPNLTTLIIKNGSPETKLYFTFSPNLSYICCDEFEIDTVQDLIDGYGYTDCEINSYCTFQPGGGCSAIEGQFIFNENGNACNDAIPFYDHVKCKVNNTVSNGIFISGNTGLYKAYVKAGNHTITPILENPGYFTISPSSITASFLVDGNIVYQDFCITPNGIHNDLDISIIPIKVARPGFNVNYKIKYKNKGNQSLSGSIQMNFQDDLLDLITSNPVVDAQSTNLLSWNYNNLQPFESKEILITFNINTPLETPSVNGGDILNFSTTIYPITGDETKIDNTFTLNQTVVNSFDPNDKTCLEGNTVTPDLIGEYVHYLIRCENTGTAEAVNIVIKDFIDITKFDITSLIITDSSHGMTTKITDNVVEFIFENINLPFDDANNDGYVAFKIKTLPTLLIGDVFENEAEIYFDYNKPIITNTAKTSIEKSLSINKTEANNKLISIYPNPVEDNLIIESNEAINAISIYDISGRLVNQISYLNSKNKLELSIKHLLNGTYFLKVKTNQNEIIKKVVKI